VDVGRKLITEGYCTVARRGEKRLQKLLIEYNKEQEKAKNAHVSPLTLSLSAYVVDICYLADDFQSSVCMQTDCSIVVRLLSNVL